VIHQISSASSLNTSVGAFYAYLTGNKKAEDALAPNGSYVDVRDVARLHIDALVTPEASNKRFAVSNGAFSCSSYPSPFFRTGPSRLLIFHASFSN
jgi:hypothetical protein